MLKCLTQGKPFETVSESLEQRHRHPAEAVCELEVLMGPTRESAPSMQRVTLGRILDVHPEFQRTERIIPGLCSSGRVFGPVFHRDDRLNGSAARQTESRTRFPVILLPIDEHRFQPGDFDVAVALLLNLSAPTDVARIALNRGGNQISKR